MSQKKKTWTTSFDPYTGEVAPKETANYPDSFGDLYAKIAGLEHALDNEIDQKINYKKAYELMCDTTWDLIPDEEKAELHKKLKELDL